MTDDQQLPTKKTWGDAFKDPKVLVVLIPILLGGLGSTVTMLIKYGEISAKVELLSTSVNEYKEESALHQQQIMDMHKIITEMAKQCGGTQ